MNHSTNSEAQMLMHLRAGDNLAAKRDAESLISSDSKNQSAWNVVGVVSLAEEKIEDAEIAFRHLISLNSDSAIGWENLSILLAQKNELAEANEAAIRALKLNPTLGRLFKNALETMTHETDSESCDQIKECLSYALQQNPRSSEMHCYAAKFWMIQTNIEKATSHFLFAVGCDPSNIEIRLAFGDFLFNVGKIGQSAKVFAEILGEVNSARALTGFGACYQEMLEYDIAIEAYEEALKQDPDDRSAILNLGIIRAIRRDFQDATDLIDKVLSIDLANSAGNFTDYYNQNYLFGMELQKFYYQRYLCNWESEEKTSQIVDGLLEYQGINAAPFHALVLADSPELQLNIGALFNQRYPIEREVLEHRPLDDQRKIRIGWFSSDFYEHATMYLMSGLFREYDKTKFEFYIYSYGPSDNSKYYRDLVESVDNFELLTGSNDERIISLAREHQLDIAVDLKGFTNGGRLGLFEQGVAPIQMTYLGYPGTLGKDFIDYIIADKVLIPQEFRDFYSESVIYLPDCYQPNDNRRSQKNMTVSRSQYGLPSEGLILASFNQAYKVGPEEFDVWCEVLSEVPDSILWLFLPEPEAKKSLIREAENRGIDSGRLFFAKHVNIEEHLDRLKLVDVFLDCFNVNAHTTASDAIWAGVPIVTKIGRQFAARVTASLLTAVDMQELITTSREEYKEVVLKLALDPEYRHSIRSRLSKSIGSLPLYDTERHTRGLECCFRLAVEKSVLGDAIGDIHV